MYDMVKEDQIYQLSSSRVAHLQENALRLPRRIHHDPAGEYVL